MLLIPVKRMSEMNIIHWVSYLFRKILMIELFLYIVYFEIHHHVKKKDSGIGNLINTVLFPSAEHKGLVLIRYFCIAESFSSLLPQFG